MTAISDQRQSRIGSGQHSTNKRQHADCGPVIGKKETSFADKCLVALLTARFQEPDPPGMMEGMAAVDSGLFLIANNRTGRPNFHL